jgi:hypothetical protein
MIGTAVAMQPHPFQLLEDAQDIALKFQRLSRFDS